MTENNAGNYFGRTKDTQLEVSTNRRNFRFSGRVKLVWVWLAHADILPQGRATWPSLAQSSPASPSLAQPRPSPALAMEFEVKANCFNFAWRNCFLLKPRSPAPKPRRRRREAPPRPTARKSLSAKGAIGGAFKARIKARVSKSTDIPCTLRGN